MLLIFALGAVFGAMLGAFSLALIMASSDYNDHKHSAPQPPRRPRGFRTPEDRRPPMNTRGQ